jgi:NADH-quinone oxidoreductase subunit H
VASIRTLYDEVADTRTRITYLGIGLAVLLLLFTLWPQREAETETDLEAGLLTPAQGGFPTPPLDLVVPPTPRSLPVTGSPAPANEEDDRG